MATPGNICREVTPCCLATPFAYFVKPSASCVMFNVAPPFAAACKSPYESCTCNTRFISAAEATSDKSRKSVSFGNTRVKNSMGKRSCPAGTGVCVVNTHLLRTFSISSPRILLRPALRASSASSSNDSSAA